MKERSLPTGAPVGQAAAKAAAFFFGNSMRTIAYIDGFNLYHAIDDIGKADPRRQRRAKPRRPHLKWVDLWALSANLLQAGDELVEVNYFSAYATWRADAHQRHIEYVKALEHVGVTCIMGHFKSKERECRSCQTRWVVHEEKETDSHMAARIVFDACKDRFDKLLLITADSDIKPALDIVAREFPSKGLLVAAPPFRMAHARGLKPRIEITPGRLEKALLPTSANLPDGLVVFTRPAAYDPPGTMSGQS